MPENQESIGYLEKITRYCGLYKKLGVPGRIFPAQELFADFDTIEDIVEEIFGVWKECNYERTIIKRTLDEWRGGDPRNMFPEFPRYLWRKLVEERQENLITADIDNVRDLLRNQDLNDVYLKLVELFIVNRDDQIRLLNQKKALIYGELISNPETTWQIEDYRRLSQLLGEEQHITDEELRQQIEDQLSNNQRVAEERNKRNEEERIRDEERRIRCEEEKRKKQEERKERIRQNFFNGKSLNDWKKYYCPVEINKALGDCWNVPNRLNETESLIEFENKEFILQYRLPGWLEESLANLSRQEAQPQSSVQQSNRGDKSFWNKYQIRYYPRTICEVFFVFNEAFRASNTVIPNKIDILSFGCGNGGDVIGLLMAIDHNVQTCVIASINVFEINDDAFNYFKQNLDEAKKRLKWVRVEKNNITREKEIRLDDDFFNRFQEQSYDFILCSKVINEFIREDIENAVNHVKNVDSNSFNQLKETIKQLNSQFPEYYKTLLRHLNILRPNAYCLILESTDKPTPKELTNTFEFKKSANRYPGLKAFFEQNPEMMEKKLKELDSCVDFLPVHLNRAANAYLKTPERNQTFVLPWCCAEYCCLDRCFTQALFYIMNPVLKKEPDRFEGVCFRLLVNNKSASKKSYSGMPIVNVKRIKEDNRIEIARCQKMVISSEEKPVSAFILDR